MKRTVLILFCCAALLQACSDKSKLPEGVLPQAKMQAVMWDMIRAADFLNNYVFYRQQNVDKAAESEKWNNKIFQMHKITREQFDASYRYYQQHPPLMKAIMDSIGRIKVELPVTKTPSDTARVDTAGRKIDTSALRNKLRRFRKKVAARPMVE